MDLHNAINFGVNKEIWKVFFLSYRYDYLVSGDVGGYLGLLIGASIITLFEVLDLVLYNIIVKYLLKKRDDVEKSRDQEVAEFEDGSSFDAEEH